MRDRFAPLILGTASLLGLQCTPQQRPWFIVVSGGEQAFRAPPDKGLKIVISGKFDPDTLRRAAYTNGLERRSFIHAWPELKSLGDDRYELFLPEDMSMDSLRLGGGCMGCKAYCTPPSGVSAEVVSVTPWAGWHQEVSIERETTQFSPRDHSAYYQLILEASARPRVTMRFVDAPGAVAKDPVKDGPSANDEGTLARLKPAAIFVKQEGETRYMSYLSVSTYGKPDVTSQSWSVSARIDGPCPRSDGTCDPPSNAKLEIIHLHECVDPLCKEKL